jgi:hypothetical protein
MYEKPLSNGLSGMRNDAADFQLAGYGDEIPKELNNIVSKFNKNQQSIFDTYWNHLAGKISVSASKVHYTTKATIEQLTEIAKEIAEIKTDSQFTDALLKALASQYNDYQYLGGHEHQIINALNQIEAGNYFNPIESTNLEAPTPKKVVAVKSGNVGVMGDVVNVEFGERKIKPKKVISTKDLKEGDNDFGNAAQVSNDGFIIIYHVTDNNNLVNSLAAGQNPKDTYITDETKREELGSGVYGSAVPEFWANRSSNKYGFLKDLPKEKQKALANKIKDTLNQYISKGYITPSEYEYGVKSVREYEKIGTENQLLSVAEQPYNIRFWENDYLKDLGIENDGIPNVVAIKAKGNFAEFSDAPYLTKADVDKLIASGIDGAFVGGGFVNNPELVIFNKGQLKDIG